VTKAEVLESQVKKLRDKLLSNRLNTEEAYLTNRAIIMLEQELLMLD